MSNKSEMSFSQNKKNPTSKIIQDLGIGVLGYWGGGIGVLGEKLIN